ncbi:MAG TPA: 6-phosphogluconolactonase [Syntrophales bacterium]|jgi:glucosamine-6-phosphate deaminase|nr:6-phosphogluconolactonase [Syntrophales bacterium]HON22537.1 6-phosphogluconolactonase [Syntrophales bacterium]HOU76770.1 6-phosphogluconolactonase [Syntrophales bacterium]HPC31893.1 6-phosphogluconolactonase [Syntrophales bacterium]HQG33555.1 6-phosphogluconolactonase [Syntrophales bacterium]
MSFKVIVTRDFDQMSEIGAGIVVRHIRKTLADKERYVLGLATGNSPTGLYKRLAAAAGAGEFPARKITSFNLDEYIGLPGANAQQRALHPESYSYFMIQELFGLLKEKFRETFVPWGTLIDQERLEKELAAHPGDWEGQGTDKGKAVVVRPDAASDYLRWIRSEILAAYEEEIKAAGGIDLHIIGVGGRGHVAFHEAGIPFAGNRMLLVQLDDNTIDNAVADGHFERREDSPRFAVSMGAELVYEAKTVLLLANGKRKAEPVAASLLEEPTDLVPISYGKIFARRGGEMIYVLDRAAAENVLAQAERITAQGIEIEDLSRE